MQVSPQMRVRVVLIAAVLLVGCSVYAFRLQEMRDWAPTPVPEGYLPVADGALPRLEELGIRQVVGEAMVLHFLNPTCPCSRFNVDHIRELQQRYGKRVKAVVVLPEGEPDVMARYEAMGLELPAIVDRGERIARATGAYATPQGVVVDGAGRLVFRGNYNLVRYCRQEETEFVRIAIEAALAGRALPQMPEAATRGYGCPLRRSGKKAS